ncbi:MAG: glycosyltransferase family 2 protein [Pyrinomonadaceae bacterium]|nr:glycosyltransferase family 2 protein [Phycisphaerales bacterium]
MAARAAGVLPLSVAIVCKNNADTIERSLGSVAGLAREVVAVDSGSTDGTIDILERHNVRIIRSPWLGHIKTKQLALEACEQEWVLSIDSDESVEPELAKSIRRALSSAGATPLSGGPAVDPGLEPRPRREQQMDVSGAQTMGFEVNRKVYYRDKPLNHVWQPEWRLRLVRQSHFRWAGLDPHDFLQAIPIGEVRKQVGHDAGSPGSSDNGHASSPPIARLQGTLRHDSISTFGDFFVKQASHARTMARSLHASGKRGSIPRLLISPTGAFLKQAVLKQGWRDGYAGWLAAASTAAGTLIKHAVLIELSRDE